MNGGPTEKIIMIKIDNRKSKQTRDLLHVLQAFGGIAFHLASVANVGLWDALVCVILKAKTDHVLPGGATLALNHPKIGLHHEKKKPRKETEKKKENRGWTHQ